MGLHLSRKGFLPRMGGNPFATPGCVRYLGIAAVALALASCSEEAGDEPQVDVTKSEITVNNNSAELSKRVTLYGKYAASTRSGEGNASGVNMPEMPEVPTGGSSKFVHKSGSKIGFLSLTQRDVTESGAVMEIYGDTDYELKNCLQKFEVGTITPINGKDVAQVDGDDVYVCLGENGVKKFTNGTEVASFKVNPKLKAAANGMYVDSKYLYVAYGGAGLFVLDKTTLKEVASYRYSGGKSANYVSVSGNILYVAYGLSGVQVFKLIEQ